MSAMTEQEAAERWCPFSRVIVGSPGEGSAATGNRFEDAQGSHAHGQTRCLGSRCMAWRWDRHPRDANPEVDNPARGYCGLAETPA